MIVLKILRSKKIFINHQKKIKMKKISLKNVKETLSRKEMRAISGGYSWLYCSVNSIDINIGTWVLVNGSIDTAAQWRACRNA